MRNLTRGQLRLLLSQNQGKCQLKNLRSHCQEISLNLKRGRIFMGRRVRSHKMMTRWRWMIWKISGGRLGSCKPKLLEIRNEIIGTKWCSNAGKYDFFDFNNSYVHAKCIKSRVLSINYLTANHQKKQKIPTSNPPFSMFCPINHPPPPASNPSLDQVIPLLLPHFPPAHDQSCYSSVHPHQWPHSYPSTLT